MNKYENTKILNYAKKIKSINYLGGSCKKCGEKNQFLLTFHHKDPDKKEYRYSMFKNKRWSELKLELDKCEVLCQNCHREFHYEISYNDKAYRRSNKKIYLEYSNSECVRCGYDKCIASLSFHHIDPKEKEFWIGGIGEKINTINELSERIKNEIDKCEVLCSNCHVLEHSDVDFYKKYEKEINEKIYNQKEIQPKLNKDIILSMYKDGMKQIDIANHFNASKSTISNIIKIVGYSKGKEDCLLNN